MQQYPLSLTFKLLALSPQIRVEDANGRLILYVKQKAFKLRDEVTIFADEAQAVELYRIKADRIMEFSARYTITNRAGNVIGSLQREGMKSLWRVSFLIFDANGQQVGQFREDNPWLKVLDALLSEIPFGRMIVNPSYHVDLRGTRTITLHKRPSMIDRRFSVSKYIDMAPADEELLLTSLMMVTLLERSQG